MQKTQHLLLNRSFLFAILALSLVLLSLLSPLALSQAPSQAAAPHPLAQALAIFSLDAPHGERFDTSGLTVSPDGRSLLTVEDKLNFLQIYKIPLDLTALPPTPQPTSLPASAHPHPLAHLREIRLKTSIYFSDPTLHQGEYHAPWRQRRGLDLEGITACGQDLIMISEQLRDIFRVPSKRTKTPPPIAQTPPASSAKQPTTQLTTPSTTQKPWTRHPIALDAYAKKIARARPLPGFSLDPNAGYEGIACDAASRRLYVLQERQPRFVLVLQIPQRWEDQKPLEVIDHFDIPSATLPRYQGRFEIPTDFAGAHVDQGQLYLLSRNEYLIWRVDPFKKRPTTALSFRHLEEKLYKTKSPYGLAEGLVVHKDRIWLVFDNNGRFRQDRFLDRAPVLLMLQRPQGF